MRGSRRSIMACLMMENTPLINAWLATTVASVETTSMGQNAGRGRDIQKGSV
jgi:hypothetical protein